MNKALMNVSKLAENLKSRRFDKKLSLRQLASELEAKNSKVSLTYLSQCENAQNRPSEALLKAWCEVLDWNADYAMSLIDIVPQDVRKILYQDVSKYSKIREDK